jgi:hypothetical protein
LIDLSPMRSIHIDAKERIARVEPGVTLAEFDREAQSFGQVSDHPQPQNGEDPRPRSAAIALGTRGRGDRVSHCNRARRLLQCMGLELAPIRDVRSVAAIG